MACLRAYNITYTRIRKMDEHEAYSEPFASVRTSIIGRPKKFCRAWSSVMKRLYISAETCAKLRQVKKAKGFTSDECTIRYLLNCCEEILAIAANVSPFYFNIRICVIWITCFASVTSQT